VLAARPVDGSLISGAGCRCGLGRPAIPDPDWCPPRSAHWIALRRVFDGEVTKLDGCWRDPGHLVPGYLTAALNELLTGRLVALADPDPTAENHAAAALTNAGTARFDQLYQTALGFPAAQCIILCGIVMPD
jgi:hypothetical protein